MLIDLKKIKTEEELLEKSKVFEGKSLKEITDEIKQIDDVSRIKTKSGIGYVAEGIFGLEKNSISDSDIQKFDIEIKTFPIDKKQDGTFKVKEPLSLNIINYNKEVRFTSILTSSLYKKNRRILFFVYEHDKNIKNRSEYKIIYVFLWKMDKTVIDDLEEDYQKILATIKEGNAHNFSQKQHKYLTLCPKHSGTFNDPNCTKSKTSQPFSKEHAQVRAFRLKNKYMSIILDRYNSSWRKNK